MPIRTFIARPIGLLFALSLLASCASAPSAEDEALAIERGAPSAEPAPKKSAHKPKQNATPDRDPFCAGDDHKTIERPPYRWCAGPGGEPDGGFLVDSGAQRALMRGRFERGVPVGTWEANYPSGAPRWRHVIEARTGRSHTLGWREDGSKHYEIERRKARRSSATYYGPAGQLAAELTYEEGRPSGTWTYYHDNKELAHRYHPGDPSRTVHEHWDEEGRAIQAPTGMLSKRAIGEAEAPLQEGVVRCYEHVVALFPEVGGRLVAQFHIGYGGEVAEASLIDEGLGHPMMLLCARRELEALTFPKNPYGPRLIVRSWELSTE